MIKTCSDVTFNLSSAYNRTKFTALCKLKVLYNDYSKTCVKRPLSKRQKNGFQDQILLNAGQKYCILQYFRPLLSYHLSLRSLFCLFLSGCFTQVLLYVYVFLGECSDVTPVRYSGDIWNVSDCEYCVCNQGTVQCHTAVCENIMCYQVSVIREWWLKCEKWNLTISVPAFM